MPADAGAVLLRARGLCQRYAVPTRLRLSRERRPVLSDVDIDVRAGTAVALVGASGSGKSTLARCLARIEDPSAGQVLLEGVDLTRLHGPALAPHRRRIQLIFQDPATAINPRFSAWQAVAEPLAIAGLLSADERRDRALALMEQVGLSAQAARRGPLEWSGGQRQRLAIARALAADPLVLILDESLSGLDLSVQAQVLNLLGELQRSRGIGCLVISHDLGLVARVASEVAIMDGGRIVERASPERLFSDPLHPHARALVAATRALESALPDRLRC